jgi:protoporphyrinogen oxidase
VTDKGSRVFDRIVSTMPIQHLVEAIDFAIPESVRASIAGLVVNPMFIVSLGVEGIDPDQYTAIYFPEAEYAVNRVSFPCTFSPLNGPKGSYSIQAEITCTAESEMWRWNDAQVLEHVIHGLVEKGVLRDRASIRVTDVQRKERSYVVYDKHYLENVAVFRPFFEERGVSLLGRFSYFEYINIDQAVQRAFELAARLNGDDAQTCRPRYFERALQRLETAGEGH